MKYNLVKVGDEANITCFINGEMYVAAQDHPNWKQIVAGAVADDDSVADLFDTAQAVAKKFERVSERVTVAGGHVFFDGDEVDNSLTKQILRFLNEGQKDYQALVNFFEKVQANPQEHSREQLFRWLDKHQFSITPEGDFVAYKGVQERDGQYVSIHAGPAVVNGESVNGYVPNPVGATVEMPRSAVHHNPAVGCSTGLHAGTFGYASGFGKVVLKVVINPRDVVSVPTDSSDQKLRVCRYKVVEVVDNPVSTAYDGYDDYDDEDEYDDDMYGDVGVVVTTPSASAKDTRLNHTKQKRDKFGRFVK